jgi:2-hydroxy-3-keto-5-methylthiopentenyl-1-phosphate phosphatase
LDPDFVVTLAMKDEEIKKIEDTGIPVIIMSYGTNDVLDTVLLQVCRNQNNLGTFSMLVKGRTIYQFLPYLSIPG